jgi:hypothetical protein
LKIPKKTRTAMCSSKILNFFQKKKTETRDSLILENFENLEPEVLNKINELPPNNGENQCWAGISM